MAKLTVLEIVQDILSDMNSDEVNSISDTLESSQVAQIVKSTYIAMVSNRNWPNTKETVQLIATTDNNLPTHMSIADDIKEVKSVFYNKIKTGETRLKYEKIHWLENDDFLRHINHRNNDNTNVIIVADTTGVQLLISNDKAPTYYTSFDDKNLVFDSYDSVVDSTLQASKTQVIAYKIPVFNLTDAFVPDLPIEAFTALLEEAKSRAMLKLKDTQDIKAEQEAGRQNRWLSRKAWSVNGGVRYPDYGRKGRRHTQEPTFRKES